MNLLPPKIYLASTSPRRFELLSLLNIPFQTLKIDVPEFICVNETAEDYVIRLAIEKAKDGLKKITHDLPVIAADTIGVIGNEILEKPKNSEEAVAMLKLLSGKTHQVYTGLSVINSTLQITERVCTEVTFRELTSAEILTYVNSGDALDKAGAYGIQGPAGAFVHSIRGNYHNVVGLPLAHLSVILTKFNVV